MKAFTPLTPNTFNGIKAGDTIWYKDRDGKTKRAKVNPLLIFSDHVMVNAGTFGTYVDEQNYVKHKGRG